jgi:hypothetical protein
MQSDSTHTMITRNRAANQLATVKPSTRSQTQVQSSSPTTRSQTQVKSIQSATKLPIQSATKLPIQSATKLPLSSSSVVQEPRMVTRSSNNSPRYDVDIDFDEASDAWRANKKSIGNGMFKYVGMRTRSKM